MYTLWLFLLAVFVVFLLGVLAAVMDEDQKDHILGMIGAALLGIWGVASLIPHWALVVRRLHDQNLSGFLALLIFVPLVGGIIIFVLMCLPGTEGPNNSGFPYKIQD